MTLICSDQRLILIERIPLFIILAYDLLQHRHIKRLGSADVMDKKGNIIFGKRCNPNDGRKRSPHPTLIGGKDPQVQCAGMIEFHKGRILSVDNHSGHYRPNPKSMEKVDKALQALYNKKPNLFDKNSKWSKNHD